MKSLRKSVVRSGLILILALLAATPADAQVGAPQPAPTTLWNFLGIPQGIRKLQGATRNRRGNHPNAEPKPPLKAIADPRNLESTDPSIKKAAEIKQAEDLKKQKIKAVKYLASIGCGCYDIDGGVTAALIASMSDCTEDVRYETIKAIGDAANGACCSKCGKTCCCNKDVLMALSKIAYERDDHGCYLEPSARVRQAAAETMRACCPNDSPPVIVAAEPVKEPARETAEPIEQGELRETAPGDPNVPPTPTPPTPPAAPEPLPIGAGLEYLPATEAANETPSATEVCALAPTEVYGYGVVIDISAKHKLAHVQFDQPNVVAPIGSIVGVYQQIGDQRRLTAQLEVVKAFPGSANVTGSSEALAAIARGDMVLRPTGVPADGAYVTIESESVVTEPAPVETEPASVVTEAQAISEIAPPVVPAPVEPASLTTAPVAQAPIAQAPAAETPVAQAPLVSQAAPVAQAPVASAPPLAEEVQATAAVEPAPPVQATGDLRLVPAPQVRRPVHPREARWPVSANFVR